MDHYLILARSVTYAQRMQKALGQVGIRSRMFRAPYGMTNLGCAYVVQIAASDFYGAIHQLSREHFAPVQIFYYDNGTYREVVR